MILVAPFGAGETAGLGVDELGEVGLELDRLCARGLPVAPGFTVTASGLRSDDLRSHVAAALADLDRQTGGDGTAKDVVLLVQASAQRALPGCMQPIEDIGLVPCGRFAGQGTGRIGSRRIERLLRSLGPALGVPGAALEEALLAAPESSDPTATLLEAIERESGAPFPDAALDQLLVAMDFARRTWDSPRARAARRAAGTTGDVGVAVHVQRLDANRLGRASLTSRDISTGERRISGRVTWIDDDRTSGRTTEAIEAVAVRYTAIGAALEALTEALERHLHDAATAECEIADNDVHLLRAQAVHDRQPAAAVRTAVELARAGVISERDAITRVTPAELERLLHPRLASTGQEHVLVRGLGVSPGAASGRLCLSSERAEALAADGESVILVKAETVPEDLPGMTVAAGIVTTRGGSASHAAVVARGMGKPAVCGAALTIDREQARIVVGEVEIAEDGMLSIDGGSGAVIAGPAAVVAPESSTELEELLSWCDRVRTVRVRANADTPEDAHIARRFGAEGIGLCRTEHQFLGKRLPLVQRYILASDPEEEQEALDALAVVQRADFVHLLEVMDGLPVTVRLLDPPLHEFLPDYHELLTAAARGTLDPSQRRLFDAASSWHEANPMLGVRGVRLAMLKPGLYPAQARALFEAATERVGAGGKPIIEVMVPLVVARRELSAISRAIRREADAVAAATGIEVAYSIGSMIETPRAALMAGDLALEAEFFSFGTNDLTQLTFGFSRDDIEHRMLPYYLQSDLLEENPFRSVDVDGVGRLVRYATDEGRATRPDLKIGVCGEHGGDPASITFFCEAALDYVSCSPYRVPVARLAAAQAALRTT